MKSIYKILGIIMILAVVSLSGCIGEDVNADDEEDIVIEDVIVGDSAEEPVLDESDDTVKIIDPVDDGPEDEVISKPSSSGVLVAGVDGSKGHGAEIKAMYAAAEAAKVAAAEAEQARLEALAATLPAAINDSMNASLEAFAAEEVYSGACDLMNATIEANATLVEANATTLAALDNKTVTKEVFDASKSDKNNATDALVTAQEAFDAYIQGDDEPSAEFEELNATLVQAKIDHADAIESRNEARSAKNEAVAAYNNAVDAEELAQEAYDDAMEALGALTHEVIDSLGVTATEAREAADAALAALEEAQEAYDILNPVVEESEETEE